MKLAESEEAAAFVDDGALRASRVVFVLPFADGLHGERWAAGVRTQSWWL